MRKSLSFSSVGAAAVVVASMGLFTSKGSAALVLSQNAGPSPSVYANGGGTGFGGTLGNGSISMQITGGGSNLDISLTPGNALNDIVVIQLDTKAGGFTDAAMSDTADGGRRAVSNPSAGGSTAFPAGILPDYGLAIGGFGSVLFELTGGSLNFLQFNAAQNISIPLSSIASPNKIDWFSYYTSDSGFMSNETMPASSGINGGGNPGFGATTSIDNHNQFVVPEPASALALGAMVGLIARRRHRGISAR